MTNDTRASRSRDARRETRGLTSCVSRPRFSLARLTSLVLASSLACAASAATNELDVARQALRDGFWSLARQHAQNCTNEAAKTVILESWARENKWADILNTLAFWKNPSGDVYSYYRVLASVKLKDDHAFQSATEAGLPTGPVYARLTARLVAERALARNEPVRAVKAYSGIADVEADDRLLLAEAQSRLGEKGKAEGLWRAVLADTNATVRATVTAAANLGEYSVLSRAATNAVSAEVRSLARLRLGVLLIGKNETFAKGASLIHETVRETPDAEGAQEAFRTLAAALLRRKDWPGAAKAYAEILEIWPASSRVETVQEGLGWALLKQGRAEEALQAFRRAEACAATDEERATSAVKSADALAALGRIEESMTKCRDVMVRYPSVSIAKRLATVVHLRELETEGRKLYREFRFAEAGKRFQEVGEGDETRRGRMAFFGVLCLYGQGRDAEAVASARELLKNTDDLRLKADVTRWLARAAMNEGRWREAKDLFVAYAVSPLVTPEDAADAWVWAARASLAANDFTLAISNATKVVSQYAATPSLAEAQIVQGEALIELARFDEAALVLERAAALPAAPADIRLQAQILRADALYAMGADNPARYEEALAAYRSLVQLEAVTDASRLALAYKTGLALEKLKRRDEARDQYYTHVVLAYRDGRQAGRRFDDEARAVFARAAFRLAEICEASGHFLQARKTLELVAESDVPAAAEARTRLGRLQQKGILP